MTRQEPIPMVRCHLGPGDDPSETLRYIPLGEFELWRYMMETRHGRTITVVEVALWVPEEASVLDSIADPEMCEPVLRVRFEVRGTYGFPVPVERFLSAETYPDAQAALLSHFQPLNRMVTATAGYFVPRAALVSVAVSAG